MKEQQYIQSVLSGDTTAFNHLLKEHQQMVFAIVLKIVGQRERAEELTQDVFVKAFQSLHTFNQDSKFSTWIYRIAYNTAISETRKSKHPVIAMDDFLSSSDIEYDTASSQFKTERLLLLQKAVNALPHEDAIIISLHYKKQTSIADIAQITGLSEANVKVKLHRIRKRLYQEITTQQA